MVAFDTLKASQRLRKAGFPEDQANALVSAFAEDIGANLATKDDIALLRKDFDVLRHDFDVLRHDVASDIESLRESMERENAALRKDFASERELLRKEIGLRIALGFTGATTLILAAIGAATGIIVALT